MPFLFETLLTTRRVMNQSQPTELRSKRSLKVKQKEHHAKPNGTNTQIHIKESTFQELKKVQAQLTMHLGSTPSIPLIIRRSLSTYLRAVSRMDTSSIADEAFVLKEHFR